MAACYQVSKTWGNFLHSVDSISMALAKRRGESGAARVAMLEFTTNHFRNLTSIEIVFQNRLGAKEASCTGTRLAIRDLLTKNYQELRNFHFEGRYNVLDFALEPLGQATNLISLTLDRYRIVCLDELMSLLDSKSNLRSFTCKHLKFRAFDVMRTLDDLYNSFIHVRIGSMHSLRELTPLLDDIHFPENAMDWSILFSKLKKLERLEIDYLDNAGAITLAQRCPGLRFLDLDLCYNISMSCVLEVLTKCPIQTLKISSVEWVSDTDQHDCGSLHIREICETSDTLINLTVSSYFGKAADMDYDESAESISNRQREVFMKEAAFDSSGGRVKITFGNGN